MHSPTNPDAKLGVDPAHWPALERLLDAALDLPPEQREAWLDTLGPEHLNLIPPLRKMLARLSQVEARAFLATLPPIELHTTAAARAGASIGPWQLVRELGSGGMASVWFAERADGLLQRPVALKLPHAIANWRGLAERMARERSILAALAHPNIARLYDAGIADGNIPWLAIEYVEGRPIDEYCRAPPGRAALSTHERIALFLQVVRAVAYAHGKLVVHRDLKPANVLVTDGGEVRLLDFGIGALLEGDVAHESQLTEITGRALTLEYAAPEQIAGADYTVISDVYSLGVILYELLTGRRPHLRGDTPRADFERAVLSVPPPRASDATPGSGQALRGDLDVILHKALKINPAERYPTANAFAEDLTRHLDGRPVLAQPDSTRYRVRKFVTRHKWGVASAAVVVFAVLGGAVVAFWQARVAIAERDRAEEVKRFIADVFEDADPYRQSGKPLSAAELLRRAESGIDARFAGRPALRTELRTVVGASLLGLADLPAAEAAALRAIEESRGVDDEIATLRARVLLAEIYAAQRNNGKLRALLVSLLPATRAAGREYVELLVRTLRTSSDLAIEENRFVESVPPAREAWNLARQHLRELEPAALAASTAYAEALLFAEAPAEEQLAQARSALKLALAANNGNADSPRAIQVRDILVRMLGESGNLHETIEQSDQLIEASIHTFGADSPAVAQAMMNTLRVRTRLGDISKSLDYSQRALEILGPRIDHDSQEYRYAEGMHAQTLLAARRNSEALEFFIRDEASARSSLGPGHRSTVQLMITRSSVLARLDRFKEAHALYDAALRAGVHADDLGYAYRMRAIIARLEGDYPLAIETLEKARAATGTNADARTRFAMDFELALLAVETGDAAAASGHAQAAENYLIGLGAAMHPQYAELLVAQARAKLLHRDPRAALPLLERADTFWREFGPKSREAEVVAYWLGRARRETGSGPVF